MSNNDENYVGAETQKKRRTILQRLGKNNRRRAEWKRKPTELNRVMSKIKDTLVKRGDYVPAKNAGIVLREGMDAHIINKTGYQIVILAPTAALAEAVARLEFPDAKPEAPADEVTDVKAALVERGDVNESDPELGRIAEATYQALGCACANAEGVTQGDVADELTGVIPAVIAVTQAIMRRDKKGSSFADKVSDTFRTEDGRRQATDRRSARAEPLPNPTWEE